MTHSGNNGSQPLSFWRKAISRMRLTGWQVLLCWKVLRWESEMGPINRRRCDPGPVTSPRLVGLGRKSPPGRGPGESTGFDVKKLEPHPSSSTHCPRGWGKATPQLTQLENGVDCES